MSHPNGHIKDVVTMNAVRGPEIDLVWTVGDDTLGLM